MFAAVLLIVNVIVLKQNWDLKAFIKERSRRPPDLHIGAVLPPLTGTDTNDEEITISYGQGQPKTILLSFAPNCDGCDANMPNWQALLGGVDRTSFRVFAVALLPEGVEEYAKKHNLTSIPVINNVARESRIAYNLRITPQTILIDPEGRVEKIWTGALRGEKQTEVEQLLNVRLPSSLSGK